MALNRSTRASNIASRISALGVVAGTPVTGGQLIAVWNIVVDEHFLELESANAKVNAGTYSVTVAAFGTPTPVTGQGGPLE